MAEQKTRPTEHSVDEFLETVRDDARREDCYVVMDLMRRATRDQPKLWGASIVGFGTYHYRYASGREGDSFVTGFSPRKNELTLYLMPGFDRHEELMGRLGKHRTGKSCLYINRLADVDMRVLEQLINASVRHVRATYP